MLSNKPRCRYASHPLGQVICQLRFPEILAIGAEPPVAFQEAIREEFPRYVRRKEVLAPKVTNVSGSFQVQQQEPVTNYQFSSADGLWQVNLTSRFISLSCSRYPSWEEFARKLDKPLAAFIQVYKPAYFERVGLRYLNFISRSALGLEGTPFRELIAPCYLGPLMEDDVSEANSTRCTVEAEVSLRGSCRAKLHAGPGMIKRGGVEDQEVKFIFDQDLYMPGQLPLNLAVPALQTLHTQAFSLFRGAITEKLHEAMNPTEL